jgi:hypothetical protein
MKVPSSSRSRSGLAWASCSSSIRAGSILGLTVIVVSFFELVLADHSKDHAVAVAYSGDTLTGSRTPLCWTSLPRAGVTMRVPPTIGRRPRTTRRARGSTMPRPPDVEVEVDGQWWPA